MNPKGKKSPHRTSSTTGAVQAECEFESRVANHRLSDVEREAVRQGIDAAKIGSFAPQEEMDEFYRLHRGA